MFRKEKQKEIPKMQIFLLLFFGMYNDYILVTDNTKHFQNIKGLQLENWKQ